MRVPNMICDRHERCGATTMNTVLLSVYAIRSGMGSPENCLARQRCSCECEKARKNTKSIEEKIEGDIRWTKAVKGREVERGAETLRNKQLTPSTAKKDQVDATNSANTWTASVQIRVQLFWSEIQMSKLQ